MIYSVNLNEKWRENLKNNLKKLFKKPAKIEINFIED